MEKKYFWNFCPKFFGKKFVKKFPEKKVQIFFFCIFGIYISWSEKICEKKITFLPPLPETTVQCVFDTIVDIGPTRYRPHLWKNYTSSWFSNWARLDWLLKAVDECTSWLCSGSPNRQVIPGTPQMVSISASPNISEKLLKIKKLAHWLLAH